MHFAGRLGQYRQASRDTASFWIWGLPALRLAVLSISGCLDLFWPGKSPLNIHIERSLYKSKVHDDALSRSAAFLWMTRSKLKQIRVQSKECLPGSISCMAKPSEKVFNNLRVYGIQIIGLVRWLPSAGAFRGARDLQPSRRARSCSMRSE